MHSCSLLLPDVGREGSVSIPAIRPDTQCATLNGIIVMLSTGGSFVSTKGTQESSQASSQVSQASFHASQALSGRVHAGNANVGATGQMPVYSSVLPTLAAHPVRLLYCLSGAGSFESRATEASSQASQISSGVFQAPFVNYDATGQMPVRSSVFPASTAFPSTQQLHFQRPVISSAHPQSVFHNRTCSHPFI